MTKNGDREIKYCNSLYQAKLVRGPLNTCTLVV